MSHVPRNGPAGLLRVEGPRPLQLPELPIEEERDIYTDDGDDETQPGTYFRPRRGTPGRRPGEADGTADHEGECQGKARRKPSHGETRYRSDDSVQSRPVP